MHLLDEMQTPFNWVRVYAKDEREVLVHVCGEGDSPAGGVGDEFLSNEVRFRFYNCTYEDVFGQASLLDRQ